jgi:hypothetical protein
MEYFYEVEDFKEARYSGIPEFLKMYSSFA